MQNRHAKSEVSLEQALYDGIGTAIGMSMRRIMRRNGYEGGHALHASMVRGEGNSGCGS